MSFRDIIYKGRARACGELLGWVTALLTLVGCGRGDYEIPPFRLAEEYHTTHIEDLASLAEMGPFGEGVVVSGRVVANDHSGNFYKSIVVEDSTGGMEVRLDGYCLASLYPEGCGVVVSLDGLWASRYDGVLQVGRVGYQWNELLVEPIATQREIQRRVRVCSVAEAWEPMAPIAPSALSEDMCGRLVCIGPVRCAEEGARWGDDNYGSYCDRLFVAEDGHRVVVRTSRYADFATMAIPTRWLTLKGVLYRDRYEGEDVFVLKIRSLDDVE